MKTPKIVKTAIACIMLSAIFAGSCFGARVMEDAEALKRLMPGIDGLPEEVVVSLTPELIATINAKAGIEKLKDEKQIRFLVGKKEGRVAVVCVKDVEAGKWGPIEYMVAMDPDKKIILDIVVLSHEELRGKAITQRKYLDQLMGVSLQNNLEVGKDIKGITGATVTSKSLGPAVKNSLILMEMLYRKN